VGTKEVLGPKNSPVILDWAKSLDINYAGDEIPCAGIVRRALYRIDTAAGSIARNPLAARQWEQFGDETTPRLGAVMVFWRESLASGKGHVGSMWARMRQRIRS